MAAVMLIGSMIHAIERRSGLRNCIGKVKTEILTVILYRLECFFFLMKFPHFDYVTISRKSNFGDSIGGN